MTDQTQRLFEEENNRQISMLSDKVSMLKELSIDIGNEVRDQNSVLDGMARVGLVLRAEWCCLVLTGRLRLYSRAGERL